MNVLGRLLKHTAKAPIATLRGVAPEETQASQNVMRDHMEAELAADRRKRGATDVRPADLERPARS